VSRRDATLRSRQTIDKLFKEGVTYHGAQVICIVRRVETGERRVLYVASRRVGNAVRRNRAKRLMREAYRAVAKGLPPDRLHIAWIARAGCARSGADEIRRDMCKTLAHAGLFLPRAETAQEARDTRTGEHEPETA
jgi:ribonuclease P protein component